MKKIPMRMCVVTKEKYPKYDLIRIVNRNGEFVVDKSGKLNGKGAYIKKDLEVIKKAKKNKILNKVFECSIDDSLYIELERCIESNE